MTVLKAIGKISLAILKKVILFISLVILPIMCLLILSTIQSLLLVPDDYIMWAVGDLVPVIGLFLFFILCSYLFIVRKAIQENSEFGKTISFIRRKKKSSIAIFLGVLIVVGYYMITNISVISSEKIITHSFFHPQGIEYSYSNIKAIHTGAYNRAIPFLRSKGEFYYIIQLDNGEKINIANVGSIKDNEDSWLTFMKLDKVFTEFTETKNIDGRIFDEYNQNLGEIYRIRVTNIFENIK